MKKLSRRDFIKGAASSAALVAAGGLLTACANETPNTDTSTPSRTWDKETDVLILGAGGSGMCAAYEAAKAGSKVLILEKTANFGGTSIRSGGIVQASGTRVQKELTAYQDDNGDKHAEYYLQEGEGTLVEELVRDMTTNSASHIEWMEELGLVFTNMSGSAHVPHADDALYADRIHGTDVGASGMFTTIHDACIEAGAEIVFETTATKLIVEDGKVVGVEATQGDKTISVKGNKGVIICTSSIDHNQDMCYALSPNQYYDNANSICAAAPGNTGDGIRMAQELGAKLTNFGGVIDLTAKTSAGINRQTPMINGFFVNKFGRRFCCEDNTYAFTSRELWREMNKYGKCYTVCGSNTYLNVQGMVDAGTAVTADTIEGLAELIGVNAANLKTTLETWNADAATGVDNQFGRMTGIAPIEGPYYAFEEGFMNLGSIGGVLINLDCQVLDVNNNPIPGLYAAGMASAGWVGPFYPGSGTALLGAIHFGRKAGKVVGSL